MASIADIDSSVRHKTPITSAGTVIHYRSQVLIGANFAPKNGGIFGPPTKPEEHAPYQDVYDCARSEFSDDMMNKAASLVASAIPSLPKGVKWIAEAEFDNDTDLCGHADLVSSDGKIIIDIKTASRKIGAPKLEYLYQLSAYSELVRRETGTLPEKAYIVYVDREGTWASRTAPIPLNDERNKDRIERILQIASGSPLANPGNHCRFCPYEGCKNSLRPDSDRGVFFEGTPEPSVTDLVNPFGV